MQSDDREWKKIHRSERKKNLFCDALSLVVPILVFASVRFFLFRVTCVCVCVLRHGLSMQCLFSAHSFVRYIFVEVYFFYLNFLAILFEHRFLWVDKLTYFQIRHFMCIFAIGSSSNVTIMNKNKTKKISFKCSEVCVVRFIVVGLWKCHSDRCVVLVRRT